MAGQIPTLEERKKTTEKEYEGFKHNFSEVSDISAQELQKILQQPNPEHPVVLVDVRTPEEREVSKIPGYVLTPEELEKDKEKYASYLIVCYCTAGFRSGKAAAKYQREGLNVKNLKGSIIAWTQEGYELEEGGGSKQKTRRVHAFGTQWANQMGDGYELQTFNKAKGALEITKVLLPKWLGGSLP